MVMTMEVIVGHYVRQLSQIVYRNNKGIQNPLINIKGFMVSNAVTNDYTDFIGTFEYWWTNGLISDDYDHELMASCKGQSLLILSKKCTKILDEVFNEMGDIDPYNTFSPTCNVSKSSQRREHRLGCRFPSFYQAYDPCVKNYATMYYNLPEVQIALHANITGLNYTWSLCRLLNWTDSPKSVLPIYKELIAACLKIWVFSGDADAIVPITGTRYSINDLNLTTLIKWYPCLVDGARFIKV